MKTAAGILRQGCRKIRQAAGRPATSNEHAVFDDSIAFEAFELQMVSNEIGGSFEVAGLPGAR